MSAAIGSREQVLGRVRAASLHGKNSASTLDHAPEAAATAREYQVRGKLSAQACQQLFIERLREYDAEVVECESSALGNTIARQIEASGRHVFVAPPGLSPDWPSPPARKTSGFEWKVDHNLSSSEIAKAEGVVTACFCGVAESGTIVLHHSPTEGRRVITLLPDWHLCVVRARQIVETLPEYFERCEEPPALVTWISGPSATADIEMTRIKGVHGPRFLNVIVVSEGKREFLTP
jgi:L-lactate dehydrogenase complex protein LldG